MLPQGRGGRDIRQRTLENGERMPCHVFDISLYPFILLVVVGLTNNLR
jgi:hypothetical protein